MAIKVKYCNTLYTIELPVDSKVSDLKNILTSILDLGINEQKIIWKGKIMDNDMNITPDIKAVIVFKTVNIYERKHCLTDGCEFYGTYSNKWYCSKCYNNNNNVNNSSIILENNNIDNNNEDNDNDRIEQENTNRCWTCNKKVGLLGFECKCKYVFCNKHRYPNEHDCIFDWKNWDHKRLKEQNVKVVSEKIEKIK